MPGNGNYKCKIELNVFDHSIMVQRNADSYLQASKKVMKDINRILLVHSKNRSSN